MMAMETEMRKQIEEAACGKLREIQDNISRIEEGITKEPSRYRDAKGYVHCETNGCYSSRLTLAMSEDMMQCHMLLLRDFPALAGQMGHLAAAVTELDQVLLEKTDITRSGTDAPRWDYEKTRRLMKEIRDAAVQVKEHRISVTGMLTDNILERCTAWVRRIMYMDTWAYCLEDMDDIVLVRNAAEGMTAEVRDVLYHMCNMRSRIGKIAVRLPVDGLDHGYVLEIMDRFRNICHAFLEGK